MSFVSSNLQRKNISGTLKKFLLLLRRTILECYCKQQDCLCLKCFVILALRLVHTSRCDCRRGLGRCRLLQKIGKFSILQLSIAGRSRFTVQCEPAFRWGRHVRNCFKMALPCLLFLILVFPTVYSKQPRSCGHVEAS